MSQLKEMIAYHYGIPTDHQVRAMAERRVIVWRCRDLHGVVERRRRFISPWILRQRAGDGEHFDHNIRNTLRNIIY